MDALAQDWRSYLDGKRVRARPDTLVYRLTRLARRYRVPLAVGAVAATAFTLAIGFGATAVVILALLLGLGAALWQARKASEQAREAREQTRLARIEGRRAEAVQRFLVDLFRANSVRQKDPVKARTTTARELLDLGAERLATSLQDAPEARVEVMSTLGEMYYGLELDEQSAAIYRQQADQLRMLGGQNDVRLAETLIRLAGSLHATGQREQILPALDEAQRILDRAGDHHSPLRGELLVRLAQRHYNLSIGKSRAFADAAVAMLRAQPGEGTGWLATALILAARTRVGLGEPAGTARLLRDAIVVLLKSADPPHFGLMHARMGLADALAQQQQFREALALAGEAAADGAAAMGTDAPGAIAIHSRWASLLQHGAPRAGTKAA